MYWRYGSEQNRPDVLTHGVGLHFENVRVCLCASARMCVQYSLVYLMVDTGSTTL